MNAYTADTTVVMVHPEKGRAVVDVSQVKEYAAAGYVVQSESKPVVKPAAAKPEVKKAK